MAEWDTIIKDPDFQDLPPAGQQDIRRAWFDATVLPEMREAKLPEEVIAEERQRALTEYDNGQGYISSGLNSAAQGFLQTGTTALQGVGAIVGSDSLEDVARGLDESVRDTFSNNPSMGKTNFVGNALGNAGAFVATMGGGGLAAKGLGLATKAGAMTGGLGVGGLAGFGGGVQQADQYGITGGDRYLRGVLGAGIEVGSEMILPGGLDAELGVLGRVSGLTDLVTHPSSRLGALRHGVLTEGVEEGIAQIGGNAATQMLQKPGGPAPDLTEGLGASMLGGAIGGVAFGAIMPVRKSEVVAAAAQEAAAANNDPEAAEVIAQAQAGASTKTMPVQEPKVEPLPEGDVTLQDLVTPVEADRTPLTSEDLPDIEGLSTDAVPEVQPIAPEVLPEGLPQLPADAPFLVNNAPPIGEAATSAPEITAPPESAPEIEPITPEAFAEEPVLTPEQEDAQRDYERKLIDTQGGISVTEAVKVFEALKALGATNADLVVNNTGWERETGSTQAYRGSHGFVNGKETVFLNEGTMKADTVIHEAGHGFIPEMETSNPELYAQGQALVEGAAKPLMEAIAQRYARNGLTLSGKDLLHETLTTLNGNESADFWRRYVRNPKAVQAVRQWIARVREWVGQHLGSKGIDPNMTVAEFAKKVNRRILAGRMAAGRGEGASLTGKLDLNAARARVQAAAKGPTVNQQETAPAPAETAPVPTNMQGVLGMPRQAVTASEDISGLAWRLRPAYDRLVSRKGTDSVFIADLVNESGLPLAQVQQWLRDYGVNRGQATLDTGDWSHATEEQRAANVELRGNYRLYARLHDGVGTGPAPVQTKTQAPSRQGATLKENNPSLWNAGATWLTQANYTGDIDAGVDALLGPDRETWLKQNTKPSEKPVMRTKRLLEWSDKARAWLGQNGSAQFSLNDDAYMAAVKSGNVAQQQAMVDEAAKAAGYEPHRVTHITPHEFTTFDRSKFESGDVEGFYFAGEKAGSTWADYAGGTRTINAYLRLTNPANISTADLKGTPEQNRKSLEARGYDGVVDDDYIGNQYIVFNPEQIKSADPVTYDDRGKVVPLSQRFQPTSPDIRFSINDDTTQQQAMVDAAAVRLIESFPPSDNTNDIPDVESIAASLDEYRTFGVRDVPTSLFSGKGKNAYHSKRDYDTVDRLIGDIGQNGIKSPLIVVLDGDPGGVAYVLEGGHRLAAAEELGLKTVPALVVYDEASASGVETDKEAARMVGRYSATLPQFSINPTPVRERSGVAANMPGSLVRGITQNLYYDTQTNKDALIQAAELYGDNAGFTFEQHLKELQDLYTVKGGDYLNATPSAYFGLISRDISNHMDDPSISESERDQAQEELTKLYQVVKEMAAAGGQFVQGIHLGLKIANNPRMEVKTWEDGLPWDQNAKRQKEHENEKKAVTRELDELAADAVKNADPDKTQATAEQHVADAIKGEAASDAGAAVLDEALGAEAEAMEATDLPPWFQEGISGLNDQLQADIDEWLALIEARSILLSQAGDASMTPAQRSARALEIIGETTGKATAEKVAEVEKRMAAMQKKMRLKPAALKAVKPASETDLKGMVMGRLTDHLNRLLSAAAKKTPQITLQKIADAISTAMLSKAGYTGVPVTGDMATALGLLLVHKGVAASALQEIHTMLESDASTKGAITREKLKAFMQLAIGETFDTADGVSKEAKPYGEKQLAEVLRAELRRADMNLTKIVKDAAMTRDTGEKLEAQLRDPERGLERLLGEKGLNDLVSTVLAEYNKTAAERADSFRRAEAERTVRQRMKDDRQAAERFEKEKRDKELKRLNDAVRDANAAEERATKKWNREQTAANDLARREAEQEVRKAMTAERKAAERWEREQAASAERQTQEAVREAKQDAMSKRREFARQRRLERIKARRAKRDAGESPDTLNYDETKELLAVPGEKIIDYLSRQFGFDLKAVTSIARMEDRTRTVKAMTLKLADSLGLSTQQAEKFSQDVVAQAMKTVDAKRKAEVAKKIEQAVKTLTGRRMKSKGPLTEAQRLIRLAETGGLSAENIEQVMLKNINAKKFTPKFRAKLEALIQRANDPHLPATSRALSYQEFLDAIQSARGIGAIGLWGEFLMSNIFFSINTFKVNFLFGGMKALADSGVMLLNTPSYVGKTEGGTRVKGLTAALAKRYLRTYVPVHQYHSKFILNTGRSMLTDDATTQFSSSNMELLANVPDTEIKAWFDGKPLSPFWQKSMRRVMTTANKYVRRIMVSTDIYHRIPAIELLKQRAVAKALVEKGGVLPTSSAEWDRVLDEAMYGMPWKDAVREANRIADDAVAAGKVTEDARGIFFGETLDGMMNDTLGIDSKMLNDQMQEEGKRVTAANPTEGIFGGLSNVLVNMAKNIPGFSFQMPAIRTPINFFTQSLDWTPWGFMRAWAVDWNSGKSSSVTNAMFNRKGRFKQWNLPAGGVPEGSVAEFRIKATIGTTSMLILGMALKADLDDDDDKAFFYITGQGPEDPMKNKLWREKGFRPLAMRIGGKWLAYQEMPGFAAFAWLGALSDTHRYGKPSETNTARMMYAFQRTVGSFGDAAVLKSMQDTIGAVTGSSRGAESSLEKGAKTAGNIASLALFPRIGKEVNDILFGKQDLKAGGWNARIFANIPFVPALTSKPARNFFGEDIHQVRGGPMGEMMPLLFHRISLVEKDDPQMRFMANMGANYISTNRRFKDGRKVMEDYEFVRDWSKKSGVELRKWLTPEKMEQYVRRKKADPDEAEKDFDRDVSRIRTRVLRSYHKVQF